MKKIFILGANGMLGRYVSRYLETKDQFEIVRISRRDGFDASIQTKYLLAKLFAGLGFRKDNIVINCIGTIKPQVDALGDLNALQTNTIFPLILEKVCFGYGIKLIHPTTDCVFTGKQGNYNEKCIHDVTDVYGRSKSLGEPQNSIVIRTSIIGEEINQSRSLIEWIKSMKGKEANGFTDHQWNGITCLEFAKLCKFIIENDAYWKGVRHFFSPNSVSKAELLQMVSDVYNLDIKINLVESGNKCDRTLSTTINEFPSVVKDLKTQIIEQKKFYDNLKN